MVDTLKSRYAISSAVGALYGFSSFLRGISSVSTMGGMDLGSRRDAASCEEKGGRVREGMKMGHSIQCTQNLGFENPGNVVCGEYSASVADLQSEFDSG